MSNKITDLLLVTLSVLITLLIQTTAFKEFSAQLYSDNAIYSILMNRFYYGDFSNALHIWWQPFYPFAGSILMRFGAGSPNALFYVSLLSNAFIFVPVFYLTKKLTRNLFLSLLAGYLVSFNIRLINSGFQLLTENLYLLLFTSAITLSYFYLSEKKYKFIIFAGIFYGLGYLTRNDILLSMQVFIVSILGLFLFRQIRIKKFLTAISLFLVFFFLIISPYLYFYVQKFGYLNLSAKFNAAMSAPAYFAPQNNLTTTFAQEVWSIDTPNYDSKYFNKKYDFWKERINFIDSAKIRMERYIILLKSEHTTTGIIIFFFGYLSAAVYFWKKNKTGLYLTILLPASLIISIPFLPVVEIRYLYWMYPLIIIFSIHGLFILLKLFSFLLERLNLGRFVGPTQLLFYTVLALFFYNAYQGNIVLPPNKKTQIFDPYKIIGAYLKKLPGSEKKVMYRLEPIAYYGNVKIIYVPTSIVPEDLKKYAKLWQADYLIADRFTFAPETPLGFLVDEAKAPNWLKPIKIWDKEMTKTVLYKFEF